MIFSLLLGLGLALFEPLSIAACPEDYARLSEGVPKPGRGSALPAPSVKVLSEFDLSYIKGIAHDGTGFYRLVNDDGIWKNMDPQMLAAIMLERQVIESRFLVVLDRDVHRMKGKLAQFDPSFPGVPADQREIWVRAAHDLYTHPRILRGALDPPVEYSDLVMFNLPMLRDLPEEERQNFARAAGRSLASSLQAQELKGAYPPQVYQFTKAAAKIRLGLEVKPPTDLVVQSHENMTSLVALGMHGIKSGKGEAKPVGWGLEAIPVAQFDYQADAMTGTKASGIVSWSSGGHDYHGTYSFKLGPEIEKIAPSLPKPDYESMLKDGVLGGLVILDDNMQGFARTLSGIYRDYFRAQGFTFGKPRPISDFKSVIKDAISSGTADYIVKEAHSGGSNGLLATVKSSGNLWTGTKNLAGNKKEVITLFEPRSSKPQEVGYRELETWMKARSTTETDPQLVYIDTACFGLNGACNLVSTAKTPKLLVIGTEGVANTFTDEKAAPLKHILDGIRRRTSFEDIRNRIDAAEKPVDLEDNYLFPDDIAWRSSVQGKASRPVETDFKVTDESGRAITVESFD